MDKSDTNKTEQMNENGTNKDRVRYQTCEMEGSKMVAFSHVRVDSVNLSANPTEPPSKRHIKVSPVGGNSSPASSTFRVLRQH
ncbi:hypothetical protein Csa_013590 [Cucumis sativus]|uniref:Uncharacterized protein n=1 Tax=Cucumis sativus TaxID=3659 RepID=A0A0A0LUM7_CUCSA|nr:hypothetical protein Csa_013590 [Cucumis sativus]